MIRTYHTTRLRERINVYGFFPLKMQGHFNFCIIGKRFQRNDPYIRIVISKILRLVIAVFHQVWIIDSNSPFRLMSNRFLRENINKSQNSIVPNIILSILAAKNCKIKFLKVNHNRRETGKPSIVKLKLFNFCIKSFRDIILLK